MKFASALIVLTLSTGALATEFYANIDHTSCSIVNGTATWTTTFGKEFIGSFTQSKTVTMEGLAPFIEKASLVSSQTPSADREFSYSMKHEGKTYTLNAEDSTESMALVRMITKICR
jgi:type 1 fimbria pilin